MGGVYRYRSDGRVVLPHQRDTCLAVHKRENVVGRCQSSDAVDGLFYFALRSSSRSPRCNFQKVELDTVLADSRRYHLAVWISPWNVGEWENDRYGRQYVTFDLSSKVADGRCGKLRGQQQVTQVCELGWKAFN